MYKIILIFVTLLFSTGAFAGECGNVSLQGNFSYEVSGVNSFPLPPPSGPLVTQSTHVVGKVNFDGKKKGTVTFKGFGSAAGFTAQRTGTGSYVVRADCTATGKIAWSANGLPTGETSDFWIVLDQMDDSQSFNVAYHANVLVTDNDLHSASGSMTRRIGKFQ
jgi:hypothetical protein